MTGFILSWMTLAASDICNLLRIIASNIPGQPAAYRKADKKCFFVHLAFPAYDAVLVRLANLITLTEIMLTLTDLPSWLRALAW
jgi:hypothetical protein